MKITILHTINFMTKLSMKKNNPIISFYSFNLLSLIVFSLLLSSCAKDPGKIGLIIQPEESKLNVKFSDTSAIYGYSVRIDSIRSDKLSVSAFGSLKDPVFGGTTAGFYTQFIPSNNGHDFGIDRTLDSLVLQLRYQGYYGDTNVILTAHTYEMLQGISKDSVYYSNLQLTLNPTDYSNFTFSPHPNDSVILITGDTIAPVLRLNLTNIDPSLGQKLLDATTSDMEDASTFQEFFKGLFVQSQPVNENGAMVYFGLSSSNTVLSLYYSSKSNDTAALQDSLRYDYYISSTTATVNKYEHDYYSADVEFKSQVINGDTLIGRQQFYAQGYGGVRTILKIPNLNSYARLGNVAVNEAKLVLPGISNDEFFDAPSQMFLLEVSDDGVGTSLPDQFEGNAYFDGLYNKSQNSYEFRITRYVQSLISDTTLPNNGLYLFLFGGSVHPERFIFKGNEQNADSSATIKLKILYTDM